MNDLLYIISLGFSGSDVWRALICAFFTAMLVNKRAGLWAMAGVALFVDRLVWPVIEQAFSGAKTETLYASVGAMFTTLLPNLGLYVVRYLGLIILIALFLEARKRLHGGKSDVKKPAAA